jgi:hypothetical protein
MEQMATDTPTSSYELLYHSIHVSTIADISSGRPSRCSVSTGSRIHEAITTQTRIEWRQLFLGGLVAKRGALCKAIIVIDNEIPFPAPRRRPV